MKDGERMWWCDKKNIIITSVFKQELAREVSYTDF